MKDCCFFYVTNKWEFAMEANRSAFSIKALMPDIPVYLFTVPEVYDMLDKTISWSLHFAFVPMPEPLGEIWFWKQVAMTCHALDWLDAYKKVIYLDCDTYLCAPVYELFDMLDQYEIMGVHAPMRYTTNTIKPIPQSFPELNIGVNPMRNSTQMRNFWSGMLKMYEDNISVYGNNDQGVLRERLWQAGGSMRLYVLPPEYNLRFNFPCAMARQVKILHGHSPNIQEIAQKINAEEGMRVWYQNRLFI